MSRKTGFTLIELLIALSIFAVVAITLYSTFFAGISVWRRSGEGSDIYQDIRIVFDDLARDLKNMIYFTKDKESAYIFLGMDTKAVFMTLEEAISEAMTPEREITRAAYSFDETKGDLIRQTAGIALGFDTEKAEKEVLLEGLENFNFEYCYDSGDEEEPYTWQEEWKDEKMRTPRGVRITASFKTGKGPKDITKITRVIFIPTGVLGEKEL